ncbi:ubiquinone biosynthesis O-methyltransferase, mitochondrial-like [Maniola jurtina]|uniref:ubiquinone biosynthesis O-methyltransferase, mitochondrial-like n=1 Tax=Maniola jurtina TaxID=191418 RepID=UPI001E68B655|nr:ubiquinone biosynthesis O-methyltransferase, mitochondrial-like [Maniola jurtina]XP_045769644.1 ubiquinone biosynthesis O-methyltransferase, mitochondrial-like [Maniola jurtina]XP_045769645.1 ubiquinone biosynthesis O-methyltransferase, mitochondrial-like [Maniola jurtina]
MKTHSLSYLKMFMTKNIRSCTHKLPCRGIATLNFNKTLTNESTVDQSHVDKHSKLAKEWWDPNGKMMALHSYNLLRVPFIRDGLVHYEPHERTLSPLSNKKILDVGCGGGILSEAIARLGANVTGIDASKELIELASEHSKIDPKLENNRPCYQCTTIEEHSQNFSDHYDAVVASEVIEHVANKELFLKSCVRAVAPGGKIFITTPNKTRLMQIFGIYVAEYILRSVPMNTHEYEKFTTPNEVTFLLERNNCHVQAIHGLMYYPIVNKWQWTSSTSFVFALQAEKLTNE